MMSSVSAASALPDFESLSGTWESPEVEPLSGSGGTQLYVTRALDFDGDAWRVRFSGWADKERKNRLFDGVGEGRFELLDPWSAVPGARAAIFHFARRLFTVHTRALASQLTASSAGNAPWAPGIQQDVSRTGALFVPALAQVGAEYDLVAFDQGPNGELELYLGDRSHEMNKPGLRPKKRSPWPTRRTA